MKSLLAATAIIVSLAATPADAWNGCRGNWNCGGGIGPGAATALGLGAFALGTLATAPWRGYGWVPPPVTVSYPWGPWGARVCSNGWQTWYC